MRTIILLFGWLSLSASALSQNLVAYYPFNGNANDQSGNSINPTYVGTGVSLSADRFGYPGKAYYFNGLTGSYMRMPADLLPTTNRTISLWFYVPDVSNRPGLLGYGGNGSCGTTLLMGLNCTGSGQYWVQGHCGANQTAYTYPTAPINNWYHWVLTINGSAQKIYVNGQLKSTDNTFSGSTAVAGKDFSLGVITSMAGTAPYTDVNVGYFMGKLDDVRIYDAAMSDAQVLQLYNDETVGLVAYYPFIGNADDFSGNGNNGTVNGATLTTDRFGNASNSYSFNGSSDFISTSNLATTATDNWSMTAWVKPASLSQLGTIVINGSDNGGGSLSGYSMLLGDGGGGAGNKLTGLFSGVEWINPNLTIAAGNVWYHVAMVRNSGVTTIYLNGVAGSVTTASAPNIPSGSLRIGSQMGLRFFNGAIDEVKVFNKALSASQVLQFYNVESPGLVAYYPFNGNANDESGNGNNPSYTGSGVALTADRFGNANKAYYFDGAVGSYIRIPADNFPVTDRTISFWFNADDPAVYRVPFSYGGNGCDASCFLMILNQAGTGTYTKTGHCNAERIIVPYSTPPVNSWKQWVITINGTVQKIYIDGILQTPSLNDNFSTPTYVAGRSVLLGAMVHTDGNSVYQDGVWNFKGKLDEFRIYNNPMTDAQVLSLYNAESGAPIAYYPFNGNANDESGNGNHGIVNGATLTTDRFSNSNKAYNFNGANNFISVADNPELFSDELTLSWWYKVPEYSGTRVVIGWVNGGNRYQQFFSGNSLAYFNGYCGGGGCGGFNPTYNNLTAVNQWQHVTVTYKKINTNESVTRLYINGELRQTDNHATAITYQPGATFFIGKTHDGGYFNGDLDDIRVYRRILSPNEILQLADVPMMPDLLAYLPMNGDANDKSGNNRNGTPYGGAVLTTDKYGNNNSAYSFDGSASGITLTNTSTLDFIGTPFTLSAWVKYSNITGNADYVISKHNCGSVNGFLLGVENNAIRFLIASGGNFSVLQTSETYNDNKWHHITGTFDGTNQTLYVDGVLKIGNSLVYNNPATGASIKIGDVTNTCAGSVFNGSIDEVKIYGASLDAALVMALYKESRGSGKALAFEKNSTNHINIGILNPHSSITIEAWIKKNAVSGSLSKQYIFAGKNNNSWGFGVEDNVSTPNRLFLEITGGTISYGPAMPKLTQDNKWHHVSVRYVDAVTPVLFTFDGIELTGTSTITAGSTNDEYSIGSRFETGNSFDGSIDEVRLWGAALSLQQIRDWKNRKLTGDHPAYNDLGYYYNFDETTIAKAYDTKNAATGQLINGPAFVTSGAAIGDASIHNLANPTLAATLSLPSGESFSAQQFIGTALGLAVYLVKDPPENQLGIAGLGGNDHYFGVEKTEDYTGGIAASYDATYNYNGNPFVSPITEPTLQLYKRSDNSATTWANSGATLNTTANTLTVTGQNTEYTLGSSGIALPVTIIGLEARKLNATTAVLNWKTATEINNKGFEVQRSFDGNYYTAIQFVNGAGNSTDTREYSITDVPGRTGRVFYRLKQIDFDGNSKLSNIVSVLFDKQGLIKIYPNPAQQKVTVEGIENYKKLQVLDATGKLMKDMFTNGQYQVSIDLGGFTNGIYLLRMINEKESQTVKLVISN